MYQSSYSRIHEGKDPYKDIIFVYVTIEYILFVSSELIKYKV